MFKGKIAFSFCSVLQTPVHVCEIVLIQFKIEEIYVQSLLKTHSLELQWNLCFT